MFFDTIDYDTFRPEFTQLNTSEIRSRRKRIQDKLLDINADIKNDMAKLNLFPHWKSENITSLTFPCEFNHGNVGWLGVRYGRSKRAISLLNEGRESNDPFLGFQKYNCFQIDIALDGVDMGIYHSVPNDAVDRMYVREHIDDADFQKNLGMILQNITGYNYTFSVGQPGIVSDEWKTHSFNFDAYYDGDILKEFTKFYKTYVVDGTHSSLLYHYGRNDERIHEKEQIESEFFKHVYRLLNFYKLFSWNINL